MYAAEYQQVEQEHLMQMAQPQVISQYINPFTHADDLSSFQTQ